jgi:hypothetical protein
MPQPVENLLEQLHTAFPELEESVDLDEGIASAIGRGIGNIGRGAVTIGRGIGNTATNFAAGVTGISDDMITSLIQAFENPAALATKTTGAVPSPAEEPQEGSPLDINDVQDTKAYFDDLVRKIIAQINDGTAPAAVKGAIGQLWKAEGGLDYSKWKWANLDKLNKLGSQVFPDWKARELPPEAEQDPQDTPAEDAAGVA